LEEILPRLQPGGLQDLLEVPMEVVAAEGDDLDCAFLGFVEGILEDLEQLRHDWDEARPVCLGGIDREESTLPIHVAPSDAVRLARAAKATEPHQAEKHAPLYIGASLDDCRRLIGRDVPVAVGRDGCTL